MINFTVSPHGIDGDLLIEQLPITPSRLRGLKLAKISWDHLKINRKQYEVGQAYLVLLHNCVSGTYFDIDFGIVHEFTDAAKGKLKAAIMDGVITSPLAEYPTMQEVNTAILADARKRGSLVSENLGTSLGGPRDVIRKWVHAYDAITEGRIIGTGSSMPHAIGALTNEEIILSFLVSAQAKIAERITDLETAI